MKLWMDWPEGANHRRLYLAWSQLKNEDEAAAIFAERYGEPPEFIFTSDGILRAGPVPEKDAA